jgi:hypothetical protein
MLRVRVEKIQKKFEHLRIYFELCIIINVQIFIFASNSQIYNFKINFILYQLTYYFSETNKQLRTNIS